MAKPIVLKCGDSLELHVEVDHFFLQCCDCMLVHRVNYTIEKNVCTLLFYRDNRRTSQRKRRAKEEKGGNG